MSDRLTTTVERETPHRTACADGAQSGPAVRSMELLDPKIVCSDNCEAMRVMESESVDLVVTSPPYDDLRTYGGHSWDFYGAAWNLKRLLKPGGVIVWVVADKTDDGSETGTSMRQALHFQKLGLKLHDTMIWERESLPLNHNRYEQTFEYVFVLSKGRPKSFNGIRKPCVQSGRKACPTSTTRQGGDEGRGLNTLRDTAESKLRGNVWWIESGFMKASKDVVAYEHPAIFPEQLAKDHITTWTNPGEIVLDPFAGSGTTIKAAKELGRQAIGIEVNPDYVQIIKRRLQQDALALGV